MITYWQCALAVILIIVSYFYFKKSKPSEIDIAGIKYESTLIPYFGSTLSMLLKREHVSEFMERLYKSYPEEKYISTFELNRPTIILRDLDLLKQMTIKDFDHFPNHRSTLTKETDLLLGNSLFFLQDEKWKDMRSTLSPAFTSSKMKNMFVFIEHCAKQVADYFLKESKQISGGVINIEAKDIFTRYTNDVIANSAFGLEINSLEDRHNAFYENAKIATTFTGLKSFLKFCAAVFCPAIVKALGIPFVDKKSGDFLLNIIRDTIKYRKEHSIIRKDMIHLLMEAEKGTLKHEVDSKDTTEAGLATVQESNIGKREITKKWNDDEIYAQAYIFLAAGFETTATMITFLFYEMVKSPDVQKKLQEEIDEYISIHGHQITYDDLPKMKYLDYCVSETLRMWPPVSATDRVCVKKYKLPPPNKNSTKTYEIQVGDYFWIPVYAMHFDPAFFPNPEKFDPDRFSDENRSSIEMNAYMPFGIGPRNCIGSRFALMVAKLIVFHMFAKFDVVRIDKTQIPLEIDKISFNLCPINGVHVGLKPREK